MADKDFVVKNGLIVNTNLLVANGDTNRVGINNSNPDASLTVTGTANVTGNVTLTGANVSVSSYTTFTGNVRVQNTASIDTRLYVGNTTTMVPGLPSIIQAVDNFNGFVMVSSQNLSKLDDACADLLIYADNTNGLSHFNDLGINNSRFDGTLHRISANTTSDSLIIGETVFQSNGSVNVAVGILRDRSVINSTSRSLKISVFENDGIATWLGAPNFSNTTGANLSLRGVTSGVNADIIVAVDFFTSNPYSKRNYPFTVGKRGDGYLYNANSALTIGTTAGGIRVDIITIDTNSSSFSLGANQVTLASGNTNTLYADMILAGTNIPSDTFITGIVNSTAFNISKAATGSPSGSYTLTDPFYDAAGNPIIFHVNGMTSNDEIARISGNGNFTIGRNNVSRDSKLTVGGTANITGNVSFGNNLTVTGNITVSGNVSSPVFRSGANVIVNTSTMFAGNSTVNATQTSTLLQIANTSSTANLTAADLKIGAVTVVNSSQVTATLLSGNVAGSFANISGQVNTATLFAATSANIASAVQANSSGVFTTGVANAQNFTVGAGYGAASVGATVNSGIIGISSNTTVNTQITPSAVRISNSSTSANLSAVDLRIGTTVVNSTAVATGTNVFSNTTASFVGNSVTNSTITSTLLQIANSTSTANLTAVDLRIGTTTVNSVAIAANAATVNTFTVSGNLTLGNTNLVITSNASHNVATFGPANVNFDSNTLFIDAVNNRIGIGVNDPDAELKVQGNANVSGNLSVAGSFTVGGTFTTTGTTEAQGNIVPLSNGYSLGNTTSRWNLVGINSSLSANISAQNAVIANLISVGSNVSINTSILTVGNDSVYFTTNSSLTQMTGNVIATTVNAISAMNIGANVGLTTSTLTIGNTVANTIANSILIRVANATSSANISPIDLRIGTTVVNSIATHTNSVSTNTLSANLVGVGSNVSITTASLLIGNSTVNSAVNSIAVAFVNATATSTLNATAYSGTANNATNLNGQPASFYTNASTIDSGTLASARLPQGNATAIGGVQVLDSVTNTSILITASANSVKNAYDRAIDANTRAASAQTAASQAYTNAIAWSGNAAQAYANAIAWSGNAALAYSNAIAWSGNAALAFSNAVSTASADATSKANNAYTTAIAWSGNSALAYANAIAWSGNAALAFSNAVATAAGDATTKAAIAYSNAVSYTNGRIIDSVTNTSVAFAASANSVKNAYDRAIDANTRAASAQTAASQAYSNAIAWSGNATLAFSNAVSTAASDATTKANNAYTTAIAWSGNAALAYSNAIAWSGNAALAFSNAVSNAQSFTLSRIIDSTTNTFTTFAASANTAKTIYDAAIAANTRATSAQTAAIAAYTNAVSFVTSSGYDKFPSGTRLLFQQTAAPTGWTKDVTHDNKALRIVSGSVSSGGSLGFTSAFTSRAVSGTTDSRTVSGTTVGATVSGTTSPVWLNINQIPSHYHFIMNSRNTNDSAAALSAALTANKSNDTDGRNSYNTVGSDPGAYPATVGQTSSAGSSGSHSHDFNAGSHNHSFNAGSHEHTLSTSLDMTVAYVDAVICYKN